ncbi:hypothetical protein NDU88_002282 [Pleurodeles waltl]|uniref:Uncharacterized protein n=1 Tax=Pleurodeles waltl TaxID=8319 RepID=A0AAV7PEV5_PLEWA|nr:hypothetical protein NDU88_002282 [Pleurodeles waltl]
MKTEAGAPGVKERRREDDGREIEQNALRKGDVPEAESVLPHFISVRNDIREDASVRERNKEMKTKEGAPGVNGRRCEDDSREIERDALKKGDIPEAEWEGRRENTASPNSGEEEEE